MFGTLRQELLQSGRKRATPGLGLFVEITFPGISIWPNSILSQGGGKIYLAYDRETQNIFAKDVNRSDVKIESENRDWKTAKVQETCDTILGYGSLQGQKVCTRYEEKLFALNFCRYHRL